MFACAFSFSRSLMLFCCEAPGPPTGLLADPRDIDHKSSKLAAGFCCCCEPTPGDVVVARGGGDVGDMTAWLGMRGAPIGGGLAIIGRIMFCIGF